MNEEIKKAPSEPKNGAGKYFLVAIGYVFAGSIGTIIGGLIMVLLISGITGISPQSLFSGKMGTRSTERVSIISKDVSAEEVVAVVKKLQPAIVNVRTKEVLSDVFHESQETEGEGSGVIYKEDGYIITNNHVVENAEEIFVTIGNEDYKGTVVGGDRDTDIAVIKIDKTGLPEASLAESPKLQVGETTVAIGSPFGFDHSVTTGVISALHRNITTSANGRTQTYTNLIQTDAAINPGNSGGALANIEGKVIGINTLIYSPSGASAGLGFSIPIETVVSVADQLIATGKVRHPYMGVLGQTVDKDVAEQLNLSVQEGAIMQEVVEGSPADKAGLKRLDVITEFDGKNIETMDDLIAAIRAKKVDDTVKLKYIRDDKTNEASLKLAEKPKQS